jgi:hypothetical protein
MCHKYDADCLSLPIEDIYPKDSTRVPALLPAHTWKDDDRYYRVADEYFVYLETLLDCPVWRYQVNNATRIQEICSVENGRDSGSIRKKEDSH